MTTKRMTPAEAVMLCRFAKAACPQQAFDEYTPDAWFELLKDMRFEDCKDAVTRVVQRQPFVAPAEIRAEVRKIRSKRIEAFGILPSPPEGVGEQEADYREWLGNLTRQIADGEITSREQVEPMLPGREMPALEGVFRAVPNDV